MIKKEIREKVLAAFKKEYKTHLEGIRGVLAGCQQGESPDAESLEKASIRAHTLKGAARAAALPMVQTMAASLETIFNRLKKGEITLNPECLDMIGTLLDEVDAYVISVIADPQHPREQEAEAVIQRINRFLDIDTGAKKEEAPVNKEKIRQKVFAVFQQEYQIHLENIRHLLAKMKKDPSLHDLDEVFRGAHTLKGAARAADIPVVQTLAHRMETFFSRIKEKKLSLNKEVKVIINFTLDAIEDYVEALRETGGIGRPPEPGEVIKTINDYLGIETDPGRATAVKEEQQPEPAAEESPVSVSSQVIDSLRIKVESLERIQKTAGQILTENQRHILLTRHIRSLEALLGEMAEGWRHLFKTSHPQLRRMEADAEYAKIAGYINLVNHHVQRLGKNLRSLKETQNTINQTTNYLGQQLQRDIQYARMVPAESVFQGFRKMVRDLARDEGKPVEFLVTGLGIQADRMVFQSLKDPIMHLLRNAVHHGIEPPHQRKLAGKEETGKIDFHIQIKGNRLSITIEDDGRGIDIRHIARMAVEKKILSQEQVETFNSQELLKVIFQPGFSTAGAITELSGRGMGLSVVKETLHRLQGDIDIRTEVQKGTRLALLVPLTIITHRLLMVKINDHVFGVPASGIATLLRLDKSDIETLENKPVIRFNDRPLPLFSLDYIMDIGDSGLLLHQERVAVMVLKSADGSHHVAVAVHEFIREQDVIVQPLPPPVNRIPYFYGGCLQVDGTVSLVLNPSLLVSTVRSWDKKTIPLMFKSQEAKIAEKKAKILIVDDSITTRTLEKTILDAHGYDVYVSVDGVEALQFLQMNDVDLVITDIAMPRLDGFGLVEEMKKNERLKALPVIIVSSLDRKEDKEKGLALGADAYIIKQKFEQQNLLETIRQII